MTQAQEHAFRQALADDALLLARLHGRELDEQTLADLKAGPFAELFFLLPETAAARQAAEVIDRGWEVLPEDEKRLLDDLAADYAATYLTHRHRVPVTESVATDEDKLERQRPMMEVRKWYERFGVAARNWRKQADDHIAVQLAFLAHLMQAPEADSGVEPLAARVRAAAAFMDEHLLTWIDDFASAAAQRCDTPFYAGLAMFTCEWVKSLRAALARLAEETTEEKAGA